MGPPVSQYMTPQPRTIARDASLASAHARMREHQIRHLPVLDGAAIVGVVSREDLLALEALGQISLANVTVADAMSPAPYVVGGDVPVDEVADAMAKHKHGCAIVVHADGTVAGIFTTLDALHVLVELFRRAA